MPAGRHAAGVRQSRVHAPPIGTRRDIIPNKRVMDIEDALAWAYRDELPKRRDRRGELGPQWYASIYPMFKICALGGRVENFSREPGFPAAMGEAHADALIIEAAVEELLSFQGHHFDGVLGFLTHLPAGLDEHAAMAQSMGQLFELVRIKARLGARPIFARRPEPSPVEVEAKALTLQVELNPAEEQGWIATLEDVSARKDSEARADVAARQDPLTGLPNRLLLQERLSEAFVRLHRNSKKRALLLVDLDRFRPVSDTLGQPAPPLKDELASDGVQGFVPTALLPASALGRYQRGEERQRADPACPGDWSQQHQTRPAQAARIDEVAVTRAHRIAVDAPRLDASPPAPFDHVVEPKHHGSARHESADQKPEQDAAAGPRAPSRTIEDAVGAHEPSVVRAAHDPQDARDCPSPRRQDLADQQHLPVPPRAVDEQRRERQDEPDEAGGQRRHRGVSSRGHHQPIRHARSVSSLQSIA